MNIQACTHIHTHTQKQNQDTHSRTHSHPHSIYAELSTFPGKVSDCSKLLLPALQRTYVIQATTKMPGKENYIELTQSLHRHVVSSNGRYCQGRP